METFCDGPGCLDNFQEEQAKAGSRLCAAARPRPAKIGGDRFGQRRAAQLGGRYQPSADDLSVVEPQFGQLLQPQFKEMHSVDAPVPDAAGGARG